tara:strand:- start:799 stop:1089 length:291 start_codon:yes stop_codon:yes gene_type:complete
MFAKLTAAVAGMVIALPVSMTAAQTKDEQEIATLYRSSVVIKNARIHIATFNATAKISDGDGFAYNWGNCLVAAELFQKQDGVKTRFWCEKGRYRK